jgi:phosphatidylserine/phosphatidylglycerophosphate/cardiolipin synthase-like enzyme
VAQKTLARVNQPNQPPTPRPRARSAWWARGDFPVRVADALVPLVDGRSAMLAMCVAFLTARRSIWLADWDLYAPLRMVRGLDQRAGPDGTERQRVLVDRLRAAGLDDEALALWQSDRLRVVDVLGFAARRGVDVRVLLWGPYDPFGTFHMVNDPAEQRRILQGVGVHCLLDKNSRSPLHMAQSLHQKCAVVDGQTAFVGGVDLTVERSGDFDRWDVSSHLFELAARATEKGDAPHPWHDVHVVVTGAPAADVEQNIRQRWDEADNSPARRRWRAATPPLRHLVKQFVTGGVRSVHHAMRREEAGHMPPGAGPALEGARARVQVLRTIPTLTYRFAPAGIHDIVQAYILAMRRAERFVYLESQYLWLEGFRGVDMLRLGWQSHYMRPLFEAIAQAAERGVSIALVLPDHPNCGRAYTCGGIAWLREHAPNAAREGRLNFYTLAASDGAAGAARYRPIYVHAKVAVVDDRWATVGSANLNSRGMSHDAELNIAALDDAFARGLRLALWSEHLGALASVNTGWPAAAALPLPRPLDAPDAPDAPGPRGPLALLRTLEAREPRGEASPESADLAAIDDPARGLELLARYARENLERVRRRDPLRGQLFPFLSPGEGAKLGLTVDGETGLFDTLRAEREGVPARHPRKYT